MVSSYCHDVEACCWIMCFFFLFMTLLVLSSIRVRITDIALSSPLTIFRHHDFHQDSHPHHLCWLTCSWNWIQEAQHLEEIAEIRKIQPTACRKLESMISFMVLSTLQRQSLSCAHRVPLLILWLKSSVTRPTKKQRGVASGIRSV